VQDPEGLADQRVGSEIAQGEDVAGGELEWIGSAEGPAAAGLDDLEVLSEPRAKLERGAGELLGVVREQSLLDAGKRA
jgi:hypothetical protein